MKFLNLKLLAKGLTACVLLLPFIVSAEHGAQSGVSSEIREEIAARTLGFTQAHITGDVAYINDCFLEDAQVLAPGSHAVVGMEAIAQLNADWVAYGVYEFTETSTRTYGSNDLVIDEGVYFLNYGPERVEEHGKYLNVWTRAGGTWKLVSNIWNVSPAE